MCLLGEIAIFRGGEQYSKVGGGGGGGGGWQVMWGGCKIQSVLKPLTIY